VAVQREDDEPPRNPMNTSDYETQAINILNKPRKREFVRILLRGQRWRPVHFGA
jgi:hypothetical protein